MLTFSCALCSHYPLSRTGKDADGRLYGVCGTVELLNSRIISTQPIVSMDWRCVAVDQTWFSMLL